MIWQDIKVSADKTHFLLNEQPIFNIRFLEVLKFHSPGIAPVQDESGAYHINSSGDPLYEKRFSRTFGYYCSRAAVVQADQWFHLTEKGERAYHNSFNWTGNYQENFCAVRDKNNRYFHIDKNGEKTYPNTFNYCGDYKDGIACVKKDSGFYGHINQAGIFINHEEFLDLGVFHKNFATAKDKVGWHHIDKSGTQLYQQRYLAIEPFYNGFALVTGFDNKKVIIDEQGQKVLSI